ncbi:MAG TPA: YncE family protein [Candidatus Acidoferrales bacterium]|jgi:DNA-binding beta-propeller fold protein YncE|nr:YncE family protein [Candidatus Acidoferrales bacterium]
MKKNVPGILPIAAGSLALVATFAIAMNAAGAYHLIKKIPIPGDGGWDYVAADSEARRLYVSHDTEIVALDLDSGAIVGNIAGGPDMHGAAIASEFGRGFISESNPGSVVIFDLKTLAKIGEVRVGDDPNGILYDHETKRIFTADRGSKRITAIDASTGKIAGTIENLGGRTEHLASDEAGHVFLNMQDRNTLLKLDARDFKVLETWSTAPCQAPSSMDIDRVHARIFIGCRGAGMMAVVDATSGRIVATNPIGGGVDAAEFDPKTGLVYFSTGADGALWIFREKSPDEYELVQNVQTQIGARTMAVDRKTGKVYVAAAGLGPRPAPTPENPRARPPVIPGTFSVLVIGQ